MSTFRESSAQLQVWVSYLPFLFFPFHTQGSQVALAWLLHRINTAGCPVTVHRHVVIKFLIINATELLPGVKRIIVIFIAQCNVTNI
jgi:hypothetical protein